MASSTLRSMPAEVRKLRDQWPSQRDRVPDLTEELEKEFRFGQRISKTDRGYFMGGPIKGGTSSMWYPARIEDYDAYQHWRKLEGLVEGRDDAALERLQKLLDRNDIELATRHGAGARKNDLDPYPGFGPIYAICADALEALPKKHLARPQFARLQLGGWGPDGAKASAYEKGSVLMYEFAIRGARRTFTGLLLHELGHAHEQALEPLAREKLRRHYGVINDADAFMGLEFLLEASTRKLHQKFVFEEFLAETYLVYTACGDALREFILHQPDETVRTAWEEIYATFRDTFDDIEYE
ncbi:MAG TPA: hypothetical protein VFF73_20620 [Planctomycetota bacterium]|nr:hypothetical protein [Planctomycetota bacterium]